MEELNKRYRQLLQAYSRLQYMTKKFVQLSQADKKIILPDQEDELIAHRDALIKRFEFCYDLTWKFCKLLLKEKYSIDVTSPRKVFQECYQQQMFTREQVEQLFEMIDARNETAHMYDEAIADKISKKIVVYYDVLEKIVKELVPNENDKKKSN